MEGNVKTRAVIVLTAIIAVPITHTYTRSQVHDGWGARQVLCRQVICSNY